MKPQDETPGDETVCCAERGDSAEERDPDYCDLYEASEIGSPCQGGCYLNLRDPRKVICGRCGTISDVPPGTPCDVCIPPVPGPGAEESASGKGAA